MSDAQRMEWRHVDKSGWARGEWDDEPDKRQWTDDATGLPCLAVRHPEFGHWCGYVGVHAGHPAHGLQGYYYGNGHDGEEPLTRVMQAVNDLSVHGGVTFAGPCQEGDRERGVCHVPTPGEPDDVWWFGFDCTHAWDLSPGLKATLQRIGAPGIPGDTYKTLDYVSAEVAKLARQIKGMAG